MAMTCNQAFGQYLRILRERNTVVRREGLGTGPNVYYILPASFPATAADGRA